MSQDGAPDPVGTLQSLDEQPPRLGDRELRLLLALSIACATLLVFAPALRNEFVNWDDDVNIVENLAFRGLDAPHLRWMFTTQLGGHYQPLTWLSFALDHQVWGMSPFGYHLTNIVLHAVCAVLFFLVAIRLLNHSARVRAADQSPGRKTGGQGTLAADSGSDQPYLTANGNRGAPPRRVLWCAALAAGLFALHPLRVESVAWVTERRDVLSGVLLMACVLAYLRSVERERLSIGWYVGAFVLFALSLLSKAAGITLPFVLLVVDVYPLGRLRRRHATFGPHLATDARLAQESQAQAPGLAPGAQIGGRLLPTLGRLVLEKVPFVVVSGAAAFVAMRAQQAAGAWRSTAEVDLISRVAVACRGAWFYVLTSLRPTTLSPLYRIPPREELLGVVSVLAAAGLVIALVLAWNYRRRVPGVLAAIVCYLCILVPISGLAQSGKQLVADRYSYLSMLPFALLLAGGVGALSRKWPTTEAGLRRRRALAVLASIYVAGLAAFAAVQTTVWHDSVQLWQSAVVADRQSSVAWVNLGEALRASGDLKDMEDAEACFRKGSELDDTDAKAFNGLGLALLELNRPAEALEALARAVGIEPSNAKYLCNVGYVFAGFGRFEEAATAYRSALDAAPHLTNASKQLAAMLVELDRHAEARTVLEQGFARAPDNRALASDLAWLLATCPQAEVRDGERALELLMKIREINAYEAPEFLDTLAAACAETGDFRKAIETASRAAEIAAGTDKPALAAAIHERIASYERGEPWRSK